MFTKSNAENDAAKQNDKNQDCVVFMTAFSIGSFKNRRPLGIRKRTVENLLAENHITSIACNNTLRTKKGHLRYTSAIDESKQSLSFDFAPFNKSENVSDYQYEIDRMSWMFSMMLSSELLLDTAQLALSFFINMDSFLVQLHDCLMQVDAVAYFFNDVVFVNFELIDYTSGVPLSRDAVFGRNNNYNIIPVSNVRYFNEIDEIPDNRKIAVVIFDNIANFFKKLTGTIFDYRNISYIHNIFLKTESLFDAKSFFLNVLGEQDLEIEISNLNSNGAFIYYSQDYLGIVMAISSDASNQAFFDCQVLESLKMFLSVKQRANLDATKGLENAVTSQIFIDLLSSATNVPIITHKVLDNVKSMESFKRTRSALDLKISYLSLLQEKKRNRNSMFLNLLLFVLAFIGGISALQVLQTELSWPFKSCAFGLTVLFLALGTFWTIREIKNK